ncbi:hypothetical protein EHW99_2521 [Erwinia amylovora]|uniref:Uncharacterized protein n=3 Tax=Erwinia amylovora TaxID=552 RepID=A0A831A239_ERWAM|nr:hypothetical protein EaACW_1069 [Erwinia amylovora ACW56400]QJQ55223.1 hypothetical protein EHX00_2521 [Erwinia amylovora]CBA20009.1 hypothetical protein predicted by Glimmer/Critica [Erwinia amylovora CFBP1430]CBX79910.1 hypothetical protein predicted by Glimmer/Critica [Erwinia amylovora ATCC BAA-2158]CCO77912.1 hypothetical protein BN432_1091 [Erwinia amylovora Ea356]CCO81699.1 hypothetical protein BN433_1105 [Erwinia amylovora Ea266]CCO85503.1 hypothetical protein BN434_1092 [Erwinia a
MSDNITAVIYHHGFEFMNAGVSNLDKQKGKS